MVKSKTLQKEYFQLTEHNKTQVVLFTLLLILGMSVAFYLLTILLQSLFTKYLMGDVSNNGEKVNYIYSKLTSKVFITNYFFNWAIDLNVKTPEQSRYWINPLIALIVPCFSFGIFFAFIVSAALNEKIGYIRQKIDREIAITLDSMCQKRFGIQIDDDSNEERNIIFNDITNADLRKLHEFAQEYGMRLEDLKTLQRALNWRKKSMFLRFITLNDGLQLYLRFYFTVKYANQTLGLVYIGAAILIIIIGLRGLKFIPSTEPSLVFFALGLEFTLLILFAFTVMYGREEDDSHIMLAGSSNNENFKLDSDLGDSKEIESLLKVFINSVDSNKKDK